MPEIKLAGKTARTNNAAEMNPKTAQIGKVIQSFFSEGIHTKLPHRKNAERFFSVYMNYETDFTGDYTYFYGQEVESFENVSQGVEVVTIPPQVYAKITTQPGSIPGVVFDVWQQVWKMTPTELGGQRAYIADFEIYDERALDTSNALADIYIGIKNS